jgi:hypothetical protein
MCDENKNNNNNINEIKCIKLPIFFTAYSTPELRDGVVNVRGIDSNYFT